MPRKLKTYTTSIGFFDLAIAAPSMKAALEAWGTERNLFHQGLAEETEDPAIVAATSQRPGVVLRRAVRTKGPFTENAELPTALPGKGVRRELMPKAKLNKKEKAPAATSDKAQKAAVILFEKEKAKRDKQREQDAVERKKADAVEDERRRKFAEKAEAIFARARERHEEKMAQLEKDRQAAKDKIDAERERWKAESSELQAHIKKARH
jgi:colicin import membrane protein